MRIRIDTRLFSLFACVCVILDHHRSWGWSINSMLKFGFWWFFQKFVLGWKNFFYIMGLSFGWGHLFGQFFKIYLGFLSSVVFEEKIIFMTKMKKLKTLLIALGMVSIEAFCFTEREYVSFVQIRQLEVGQKASWSWGFSEQVGREELLSWLWAACGRLPMHSLWRAPNLRPPSRKFVFLKKNEKKWKKLSCQKKIF